MGRFSSAACIVAVIAFTVIRNISFVHRWHLSALELVIEAEEGDRLHVSPHQETINDIILKWNISTDSKKEQLLLDKIWKQDIPYNPNIDLIVFFHPLKSGGTSLSKVLKNMGGVVPGSHASGFFNNDKFKSAIQQNIMEGKASSKEEWWSNQRVLFSHNKYRGFHQSKAQGLATLLHDDNATSPLPMKRIRHITMVRDPLAYAASNYNEWFCMLDHWQKVARKLQLPPSGGNASCSYTLDDYTKARVITTEQDCKNRTQLEISALGKRAQKRCKVYLQEGKVDPDPDCSSISTFLASENFQKHFKDRYADQTYNEPSSTIDDYIYGALEYLGGLDTTVEKNAGDMMWFGN